MLLWATFDQNSVIVRVKVFDSSVTTQAGKTGLTSASTGLLISIIADNEATPTVYTSAGSTIETIATLGTYAAPTATKCRFKELQATDHPGIYELQFADARFGVAGAKSVLISLSGVTNMAQCDVVIALPTVDLFDAVRAGLTALPNAAADAAGGLPISDAGGLDLDALNTAIAAIQAQTDLLPSDPADASVVAALLAAIQSGVDALQSRLPAALTGAGNIKADALAIDGSATSATRLRLAAIVAGAVTGATTTSTLIDSSLTHPDVDQLKGRVVLFSGNVTPGLRDQAAIISAFDPTLDKLTFSATLTQAPAVGDAYVIV